MPKSQVKYFASSFFYFSSTYDLTSSVQNSVTESRFIFNTYLQQELRRFQEKLPYPEEMDQQGLLIDLIQGYVSSAQVGLVNAVLISRLSTSRAGVRFQTRGIDDDGISVST